MPAPMLVFTTMQPIVGIDIHTSLPPVPTAPLPHTVVWATGLSLVMMTPLAANASKAKSPSHPQMAGKKPIAVGIGHVCGRGHDAGPHLGHIAGNTLLSIIWLGAGSKAEFGSGSVHVCGDNLAINLMMVANLQLNCSDPAPLPTGVSFALGSQMVFAGFTLADLLNGLLHMVVDIALSVLLNIALGAAVRIGGGVVKGALKKGVASGLKTLVGDAVVDTSKAAWHDLEDSLWRRLSNGRRVMDWSRLTPRGFAHQMSAAWNSISSSGYFKEYVAKDLARGARDKVLGWLEGSPIGTSASSDYSPGAVGASEADNTVDGLVQ